MKNQFDRPQLYDHAIVDENDRKIGEVRVTPTAIKWKGKGKTGYRSVPLDNFINWIKSPESGARNTKK